MWKFRRLFLCLAPPLLVYFGLKCLLLCPDWSVLDYGAAFLLAVLSLVQWIPLGKGENFWTQGELRIIIFNAAVS